VAASSRRPLLELLYRQFLTDEHSASFIKEVSTRYSISTLERLAQAGSSSSRCCATLALGFLADFSSNQVLAGCLHDESDAVRMIAERSIREVWLRDGSDRQRQQLSCVIRMNASGQLDEAIVDATELIESLPEFAEAWNQRAIAYFQQRDFDAAAEDCRQTLERNPCHYGAAVGLAHCYLQLDDVQAAVETFHWALDLNPGMEGVRAQLARLKRALG